MIRLFKETVEKLLLALIKVRLVDGVSAADIIGSSLGYRGPHAAARLLLERIDPGGVTDESLDQLITEIVGQLEDARRAAYNSEDATLVDAIVRTIQLPYTRNFIGNNQLSALRAAVLTSTEVANLNATLAKRELQCGLCQRRLVANEMVTVVPDSYNSHTNIIVCHHCRRPTSVACDRCNKQTDLPVYLAKASARQVECGCATRPKQAEEEVLPDINAPQVPVEGVGPRLAGRARPRARLMPERDDLNFAVWQRAADQLLGRG